MSCGSCWSWLIGRYAPGQSSAEVEPLEVLVSSLGGVSHVHQVSPGTLGSTLRTDLAQFYQVPAFEATVVCCTECIVDAENVFDKLNAVLQGGGSPELQFIRARKPRAVAGCRGGQLALYDLNTYDLADQACIWESEVISQAGIRCIVVDWIAFQVLCACGDSIVRLVDLYTGAPSMELSAHTSSVESLAVDWTSKRFISGSADETMCLWNMEIDSKPVMSYRAHRDVVTCLSVDWSSGRILSGAGDSLVIEWDLKSGKVLQELHGHELRVTCISAAWSLRRAITGSEDLTLRVWDLKTSTSLRILNGHDAAVSCVSVDWSAGRTISGSSDCTLKIWDLESGTPSVQMSRLEVTPSLIHGLDGGVQCLAVDWSTERALCGNADGSIQVWDFAGAVCMDELQQCDSVADCLAVNCI